MIFDTRTLSYSFSMLSKVDDVEKSASKAYTNPMNCVHVQLQKSPAIDSAKETFYEPIVFFNSLFSTLKIYEILL